MVAIEERTTVNSSKKEPEGSSHPYNVLSGSVMSRLFLSLISVAQAGIRPVLVGKDLNMVIPGDVLVLYEGRCKCEETLVLKRP